MGRMSDLWKNQPSNGVNGHTISAPECETISECDDEPIWEELDTTGAPFIEVGGEKVERSEKGLRLVKEHVVTPIIEVEPTVRPSVKQSFTTDPLTHGLFTVRFRPVIAGVLATRGFGPELIAYHDAEHFISEQYRQIVAEVAPQLGGPPRVLLFTGSAPESGTTTVLLNVAMTLLREKNTRVTVVDANWSRPSLAKRLGLSESPGLRDVLAGRSPLQWAMQTTRQPGLSALVAGRGVGKPAEAGIPPVIDRLRGESDWILIDAPTWSSAGDSVPLADCCDGMYLVIRQPDADSDEALALQQDFLESTGRLKGCVLTQR